MGFGSFFNHFPEGKEEFFEEAVLEVLDLYAAGLAAVNEGVIDPAEVFARSFRLTGRIALSEPALLAPLLSRGTEVLLIRRGLRESALADLDAGVRSGRFAAIDPEVHLMAVGGVLLGLVRLVTADPGGVSEQTIDDVTAGALRLLGVSSLKLLRSSACRCLICPPCAYRTRGAAVRERANPPSRGRSVSQRMMPHPIRRSSGHFCRA